MTDEPWTLVEVTYAGRILLKNDEFGIQFYKVDGGDYLVFTNKKTVTKFRYATIGGVYNAEQNGDSFRLQSDFVRNSEDSRIADWRIAQQTLGVRARALKLQSVMDQQAKDELSEMLRPIRRQWSATDNIGKAALEAMVLNALRKGYVA